MSNKLVLAYSGGLDTSVILAWLCEKGFDVIAYVADVGQKEDFDKVADKAKTSGASKVYVEDLKQEFVEQYIYPALRAGATYEGRYLLGTSLSRPLIAKRQIEIARKEGATHVSHGSTGKGNDQVRFELSCFALHPEIQVIAPWKDKEFLAQFKGRDELLAYAESHGIPVEATKKANFSMDANLMHISYESGILEDPATEPPEGLFRLTKDISETPDEALRLAISFENGNPTSLENLNTGEKTTGSLELFNQLNSYAGEHGVGRIDIVENRFVGIKSRGVYETPAGTVLWAAHQDLETFTLDREVLKLKTQFAHELSYIIYNGFWFSPEYKFLQHAIDYSQRSVNGTVYLELHKGNVTVLGRESETTNYNEELASMLTDGGYDQQDAKGFIKVNAVRLRGQALDGQWMVGKD